MLRVWVNTLNILSRAESALADRIGDPCTVAVHFLFFWGVPAALLYLPPPFFPVLGIAMSAFYIYLIAGDMILSVFGHEGLEHQRGMLDITSVREMRKEIFAALIKYLGGAVSFATIYNGIQELSAGGAFNVVSASTTRYFDLFYFSLITISTVGYGDIYPLTPFARTAVMAEIVFGLGYAILLFSMLVSLYIDLQRRKDMPSERGQGRG